MSRLLPNLNRDIRAEMARAGETQLTLAHKLGLSQSRVSRRLNGEADWTVDELLQLADVFGVPLSTFLPVEKASA